MFKGFMDFSLGRLPNKEFLLNMDDPDLTRDMEALLRSEIDYDQKKAIQRLNKEIIEKFKGWSFNNFVKWKGEGVLLNSFL